MGHSQALGRRVPNDFDHVHKYGFSAVAPSAVSTVEKTLLLPWWHNTHDQGREGSCVGHGGSMERSIVNTAQNKLNSLWRSGRRYDPLWAWDRAKEIDEWSDTNPGDSNGTSVRAFYDVMRTQGHRVIKSTGIYFDPDKSLPTITDWKNLPSIEEGIEVNRWAENTDEIRTAISEGKPVTIGVNWYSNFYTPLKTGRWEYWIGRGSLGTVQGGHCVVIIGASDSRQAFLIKNSWGKGYPLVWVSYQIMQRLLNEYGEAALVTDK